MKKKLLILLVYLCMIMFPLKASALDIDKNWNTNTDVLPSGSVGKEYNFKLKTTENDLTKYVDTYSTVQPSLEYTYKAVKEDLPDGLTLNEDGTLSGTPTKAGKYSFYVTATRAITGELEYYGKRFIQTYFTIYIFENELNYSSNIAVTSDQILSIYENSFNKITNNGNLSILNSTSTYNKDGYLITNNNNAYLYDVTFQNGASIIDNKEYMTLDNTTFYYNESDDYIVYNEGKLILDSVKFIGNKSSEYSIYNSGTGNIFLKGTLNTYIINDNDYTKDNIYLDRNSSLYFDIRDGSATILDYLKLQGYYSDNLYVILSEDMDNEKDYTLIENFDTNYEFKDGYFKTIKITKETPWITFVTSDDTYRDINEIGTITVKKSLTYNNHVYKLVQEKKKLVLKITKVNDTSTSNELPITGTIIDDNDTNNTTNSENHVGDIITEQVNVKNVIILSAGIILVTSIVVGTVIIIKKKKTKK